VAADGAHGANGDGVLRFARRDFIRVCTTETVGEAERLMRFAQLRHLPVVDGEALVGTLSYRRMQEERLDALERALPEAERGERRASPIGDWVQPEPEAVSVDASLEDAVRRMLRYRVGYLPVVARGPDGPRVVGILTEADLLRIAFERGAFA
jgi:CBS domain-containing protein